MIDFDEELKNFRPSLDVDDIEEYIGGLDLTDMNDVMTKIMLGSSPSVTRSSFGTKSPDA